MKITFVAILSILAYVVSSDIYTPSMPSISLYFGESSDAVQRTLTFFFLGAAISCFVSGYLADIWGKKRICTYGFAVGLLGGIVSLISVNLEMLILGRFLMGSGLAVAPVVGLALLQESLPENKALKVFGLMGVVFAIVPGIAPMIGGVMDAAFGWRSNFFIIFLMIFASLACTYFFLENDRLDSKSTVTNRDHIFKTYGRVLSNRSFLAYSLMIPLIYAGEWATFSFLPFYAEQQLNLSSDTYGFYLGAVIVWFGAGSLLGGKLAHYIGIDRSLHISLIIAIMGGILLLLTSLFAPTSALMIYISLSLYFLSFGVLFPTSVPKALGVFTTLKASASAIRGMMITLVGFFATYIAEVMDDSNLFQLASVILLFSTSALGIFTLVKPKVAQTQTE